MKKALIVLAFVLLAGCSEDRSRWIPYHGPNVGGVRCKYAILDTWRGAVWCWDDAGDAKYWEERTFSPYLD